MSKVLALGVLAALMAGPAVAADAMKDMPGMAMSHGPADDAMTAGMTKMQHDMGAAPMTGDPDRDFVAMMLPHHQGAVDMAEIELKYGTDPKLKALARGIIAAQEKEIAFMQAWLAKHPAPAAK